MAAKRTVDYLKNNADHITKYKSQFVDLSDEPRDVQCLLCETKYVLPSDEKNFLTHLFSAHRLIIGDVWKIASLKSYIKYWRMKFQDEPLVHFCTTLLMDCTPDGKESKNESYFLLSDCLSEDKTLREELHYAKLEWVLAEQSRERSDTSFNRGCMLCRTEFSGLRSIYLKHLSEKHNIQLGKPENLVLVDQFLDVIEQSIENLICIFCEKKFKTRIVLREHMRKKMHKRVNPHNKYYDRFYITNYLELGRSWRNREKPEVIEAKEVEDEDETIFNTGDEDEDESGWSDWNDDSINITCLFCKRSNKEFNVVLDHMTSEHHFNLDEITSNMDFYEKIKVVNFVRHQMLASQCIFCDEKCDNVVEHMEKQNHYKLPESKIWRQPEFYFPMFEDDSFLYTLDVNSKDTEDNEIDNDNFIQTLSF